MKPRQLIERIGRAELVTAYGHVTAVTAGVIRASGPDAAPGALCEIAGDGDPGLLAEVIGIDESGVRLMPLSSVAAIGPGARVTFRSRADRVPVGNGFAGRVVDALGAPLDNGPAVHADALAPASGVVPRPLERAPLQSQLRTGLRVVDGLLPLSSGQRIGVFAASGVGKTSFIEQLAPQVDAQRCIFCLVGERGREVAAIARFVRGRDDSARFTIVAATSDESPALRARAVDQALAMAEYWRGAGEQVLLILDSATRYAMALRELGLAAGAPPTVRAYTPNVFAALPRLVERCGALVTGGSITAVMTVLSETDDIDDPIVEVMKSLLDGHILLSRTLAEQGHFPAVDVPRSVSRGADTMVAPGHRDLILQAVAMLATYEEARIMIETGVYKAGSNPAVDRALACRETLLAFLRQRRDEVSGFDDTLRRLGSVVGGRAGHA